jgi:cytochrome c oxidase subunit I+III
MVLGGFLLARSWSGHLQPRARATLDNVGLLWQAAALQGILGEAILRLVPALMG